MIREKFKYNMIAKSINNCSTVMYPIWVSEPHEIDIYTL